MKAAKLLQIGAELLSLMSTFDLKVSDFHHLELYSEYIKARQNNEKYSYIIASLAERYGMSESSVKRIIRRFSQEV